MEQRCKYFLASSDCGLAVSTKHPWLAATPDSFVNDPNAAPQNMLEEYKNPHPYRNSTIQEGITNKQIKFLTLNNGTATLKRSHHYISFKSRQPCCSQIPNGVILLLAQILNFQ